MNKKPISTILQHENFNNVLFKQSISLVQSIKSTIPVSKIAPQIIRSKPEIKKKQQLIQTQLSRTIKLFGQILGTQKNTLGTVKDYAVDVFQELTDLIETSCHNFNQKKKNIKTKEKQLKQSGENNKFNNNKHQSHFSHVKPAQFNHHTHSQPITQKIRISCPAITNSQHLSQPYIYISTVDALQKMISQLSFSKQIAVDLQHSNKSYQGFTCLIQISSRQKDYIIDVFPIWSHIPKLKRIFQNQNIIKVMHGADMDTKWLQRDFDIHIVNLFDTYKASRVLGFPKFSYAYLLSYYCDTFTDKKYQLADWRQRPLIPEMLHYARLDTHYLLQIWDKILQDLWKQAQKMNIDPQSVIKDVYKSSHQVTLIEVQLFCYKKKQIYQNIKNDMKAGDFQVIQKVFWTIDKIAKQQDQCFDDLVNKRTLVDIISRTKDLIQNKRATIDMLRVKIDRLIGVLRSHKHQKIGNLLIPLKKILENQFLQPKKQLQIIKKKAKTNEQSLLQKISNNKIVHEQKIILQNQKVDKLLFHPAKISIQQLQYPLKTYQNFSIQQKISHQSQNNNNLVNMIQFAPIMTFLSQKFHISQKVDEIQPQQKQEQQMQLEESNQNIAEENNQKQVQQGQMQGFMQFKRIKPNVIYTIQQEQVQQKEIKSKPKKKRKEQEYQKKLRNKQGNIYDLLQDIQQ